MPPDSECPFCSCTLPLERGIDRLEEAILRATDGDRLPPETLRQAVIELRALEFHEKLKATS